MLSLCLCVISLCVFRMDPDLLFQERLASERLTNRKEMTLNLPNEQIDVANIKSSGKLHALLILVEEMTWKHAHEWQVCENWGV